VNSGSLQHSSADVRIILMPVFHHCGTIRHIQISQLFVTRSP